MSKVLAEESFGHVLTAIYHSLQLLILHTPHLEGHVPVLLHVGCLLGAMVFFWTAARIILMTFKTDWHILKTRWQKDHVVICGLGRLGLPLALQAKKRGRRVVAIEKDVNKDEVLQAVRNGIPVVVGDAADIDTLRQARADRAREMFAVCTQDETNIGIAAAAADLQPATELSCWLFVSEPQLRSTLQRNQLVCQS